MTQGTAAATVQDRPWIASYPSGVPAEVVVPDVPVTRLLDDAAARFPQRTAVAFLGTHLSYAELVEQVDAFAAALTSLGVKAGDRVALVLPNCPQNVVTFYAVLRIGAIAVQHNPLYTESELAHQLADCGATVAVVLDRTYAAVDAVRSRTALQHVVVTSIADYLPTRDRLALRLPLAKARRQRAAITAVIPDGAQVLDFQTLLKKGAKAPATQVAVDAATDVALLQYTTGTTGVSKGAMLTHRNLVANATQVRAWMVDAQDGREVTLAVLPLFHVYGLTLALGVNTTLAGTLVLLPRFDQTAVLEAIATYRPTLFPGVAPIYRALADNPATGQYDLTSLRACVSGAMKLPDETKEAFERFLPDGYLIEGYGLTETSPVTHCNPVDGSSRTGTVGLPLPSTDSRVVDLEDPTKTLGVGETGELAVRGPQVFAGYWNRPAESAATLITLQGEPGWILTGDVATVDADGFVEIVDRKKELIIAGGFNIYPTEVEEVVARVPGVQDVCVIGVPDRYRGETVKAFVVLREGAEVTEAELTAACADVLTPYKVPKVWEFRDSLPKIGVGKVLRRALRDEERAKAAAAEPPTPSSVPGGVARPRPADDQVGPRRPMAARPQRTILRPAGDTSSVTGRGARPAGRAGDLLRAAASSALGAAADAAEQAGEAPAVVTAPETRAVETPSQSSEGTPVRAAVHVPAPIAPAHVASVARKRQVPAIPTAGAVLGVAVLAGGAWVGVRQMRRMRGQR